MTMNLKDITTEQIYSSLVQDIEKAKSNLNQKIYAERLEALEQLKSFSEHEIKCEDRFVKLESRISDIKEVEKLLKNLFLGKKVHLKLMI